MSYKSYLDYMDYYDDDDYGYNDDVYGYNDDDEDGGYSFTASPRDPARIFRGQPWPFYDKADPDEKPCPEDNSSLAEILTNALLKTEPELPFAGRKEGLPTALKLEVEGVGTVTLPLNEEQAGKVLARCEKEPASKPQANVWELHEKFVELEGSEWWEGLDKLAEVVTSHVELQHLTDDEIMDHPTHNLVLYGQGNVVLEGGGGESGENAADARVIVPYSPSDCGVIVVEEPDALWRELKVEFMQQ
ncbi:uncharacterized protein IUM83_03440 [Phytophthora cinnamomi]|uniref:uncharacterized protein n=1 Tax=Phytophthora cinnamomi TaxID=4785 RepID=UPI003559DF87|nr:hypothetical protein IUM83_03440 [Phytophthora cinnamomi]